MLQYHHSFLGLPQAYGVGRCCLGQVGWFPRTEIQLTAYLFCSESLFNGFARQTMAVPMTPAAIRRTVRNSKSGMAPLPEKFILNKPKPRENPIEIQIEAVVIALGHSFMFIDLENVK